LLCNPILGGQITRAEAPNLPTLEEFATSLNTAEGLAGLYSDGLFALPIIHQPRGNPGFVSSQPGVVTQFSMAEDYNTTGLLAHNTLAGAEFEHVTVGQILTLVYANGERKIYQVSSIERYQALNPHNTRSDFLSIAEGNMRLTATELFNRIYAPGNRLVLQTCIANQGNFSWGRMFIIAQPVTQLSMPITAFDPMPSWFMGGGYAAR
jgi:hypothetical protein